MDEPDDRSTIVEHGLLTGLVILLVILLAPDVWRALVAFVSPITAALGGRP